jgi:hypothetical protein
VFLNFQPIIPVILAYLTPSYTDKKNLSNDYIIAATAVHETLLKHNINIDLCFAGQLTQVIEKLFDNLIDNDKMKQMLDVPFLLNRTSLNIINYDTLVNCLTFLEV